MASERVRELLLQYGWIAQMVAAAASVLLLGWWAGRARPRSCDGWRHAYYTLPTQLFVLCFAAFMTAAMAYNRHTLLDEAWWVIMGMGGLFLGGYFFAFETLVTRLRWNAEVVEVRRWPCAAQSLAFDTIRDVRHHAMTESVSLIGADGQRLWFFSTQHVGVPELMALVHHRLAARDAAPESLPAD